MEKLAIDGGAPVRATPIQVAYPGGRQIGAEEIAAVTEVLSYKSPFRYYGPEPQYTVQKFERAFAEKFGRKYALGTTSGTAALLIALKGVGVGPGDKVIVPALSFVATAGAVVAAGAVPVFAEIDDSLSLVPSEIDRLADAHTKAVVAVPLHGNPCRMEEIMQRARAHGLKVVEDVAQSCGSKYHGKYSGSYGDAAAFSMQLNKIISTGDGGVVVTDDPVVFERMARFHDQGSFREKDKYPELAGQPDIQMFGQNLRMNEMSGAVACIQLQRLDGIVASMREKKAYVKAALSDLPGVQFRTINDPDGDAGCTLCMFLPTREQAARWGEATAAEGAGWWFAYGGVPTYMIPFVRDQLTADGHYPFCLLDEPVRYYEGLCPQSEDVCCRNVEINFDPTYTQADLDDIIAIAKKVAHYVL